jgi:hypothetical protein
MPRAPLSLRVCFPARRKNQLRTGMGGLRGSVCSVGANAHCMWAANRSVPAAWGQLPSNKFGGQSSIGRRGELSPGDAPGLREPSGDNLTARKMKANGPGTRSQDACASFVISESIVPLSIIPFLSTSPISDDA